jgi:uncharacterized protein (UPF0332 family)
MDGRNFIALAGRLAVAPAADEAMYRTAVSRAYYGAFHLARGFLFELGFAPVRNANIHGLVRQYLNGSKNRDARVASSHLQRLQTARNQADYDLDDLEVGSQAFAMATVERAHRVAPAFGRRREGAVRDSIRPAIAEYERRIRPW